MDNLVVMVIQGILQSGRQQHISKASMTTVVKPVVTVKFPAHLKKFLTPTNLGPGWKVSQLSL
jgi:hypothetical protein